MDSPATYLLVKHGLYYRPDNMGYTGVKARAGRYTKDEADRRSGVTAVPESRAPMFSRACWEDVKVEYLLGIIADRDAEIAALKATPQWIARRHCWNWRGGCFPTRELMESTMPKDKTTVWPAQLTPVLRDVLGRMCFQLGGFAHVYQKAGEFVGADGAELKRRAEDEQAFMLHKLVGYALEHGERWTTVAQDDLNRARAIVEARAVAALRAQTPTEDTQHHV